MKDAVTDSWYIELTEWMRNQLEFITRPFSWRKWQKKSQNPSERIDGLQTEK
jgi:hypothetical protein